MTLRRLPLFPLPLVLLPRARQPLHVFEPRYRRMVSDCLEGDREFGVLCRTPDVAEREIAPGTAGCVAHIESSQLLPDGRSNILVVGGDRFTLREFVADDAPYHVGQVELFGDAAQPNDPLQRLADAVRSVFARVGRAARAMQDDATPLPDLSTDPALLAFSVAQYVDLDVRDKQWLLSSRSPGDRLRRLHAILTPLVEPAEQRATAHDRARANGRGHEAH